jgi:hypothetical protein
MLFLILALLLLSAAVAFGLSVLRMPERSKLRPATAPARAFDESDRLVRGEPDPDLAAIARGRRQT